MSKCSWFAPRKILIKSVDKNRAAVKSERTRRSHECDAKSEGEREREREKGEAMVGEGTEEDSA